MRTLLVSCLLLWAAPAVGQDATVEQPGRGAQQNVSEPRQAGDEAEEDDSAIDPQIEQWIDQLGSPEFAVRERAASELVAAAGQTGSGADVIARLSKVQQSARDPEVKLRLKQIVTQVSAGDMKAKIDRFLAGGNVDLPNWNQMRGFLGDTPATRDLYVKLITDYPNLVESLNGQARDRVLAMDAAMARVQKRIYVDNEFVTKADMFALLLAASDPQTPIKGDYESLLINVMNQKVISELLRDPQLSGPFELLLGLWIIRSSAANRVEVLELGMRRDIEMTLELAKRTLRESEQAAALARAMQTLAKFGDQQDADQLLSFVDDQRLIARRGFDRNDQVRTELGDVAMAAIAVLQDIPLSDLGMDDVTLHPAVGFVLEDVGYRESEAEKRTAAKQTIQKRIAGEGAGDENVPTKK